MNIKSLFLTTIILLPGAVHIVAQTKAATPNPAATKSVKEISAESSRKSAQSTNSGTKAWRVVVTYGSITTNNGLEHTSTTLERPIAANTEAAATDSLGVAQANTVTGIKEPHALTNKPWTLNVSTKATEKEPKSKAQRKTSSGNGDWTKTWSLLAAFNTSFNSNLEHDPVAVKAAGFVPSVTAGYQLRSNRHRIRFIYALAGSRYTRGTDLNRVGNYFGTSYRLALGKWTWETEGEAMFKGTNDDRETNNQFIATQKLGYRFNDATKATVYYAYRLRRFSAVDADRNAVNPIYGIKFERKLGSKLDWEVGYRYDQNRALNPRQNYIRSTYSTSLQYQLTKRDLMETGFTFKPRLYSRLVDVDSLRVPRRDRKYSVDAKWRHEFGRFGFELGYRFEKQNSNDTDKIYKDHQIDFSIFYHWGNGEKIKP